MSYEWSAMLVQVLSPVAAAKLVKWPGMKSLVRVASPNVPVEPAKLKFAPLVPDRLPVNVCAFGIVVASDTSVELLGELSTA